MAYRIFVSYKNGAKSHSLNTTSRFLVEAQLASILAESEILSLAERIVIQFSGRDILNAPASLRPPKLWNQLNGLYADVLPGLKSR